MLILCFYQALALGLLIIYIDLHQSCGDVNVFPTMQDMLSLFLKYV